jgi:hypothetical protein
MHACGRQAEPTNASQLSSLAKPEGSDLTDHTCLGERFSDRILRGR